MSARFQDLSIINVYAPSGTARRQVREFFYASELPLLLTDSAQHIVLGGTSTAYWNGEMHPVQETIAEHWIH